MPTRNGAVRVRPRRSGVIRRNESSPLQGRPVRRSDVGAGAFRSLTQVRRTVLLAEKPRLCICSGERFPVAPGEKPMTPLISSWNRRILFFTGQRALFQDGTSFSLRFPSYFLSGARPAGMLRRPGHRKNHRLTGPLPGFLWRTAPTTE